MREVDRWLESAVGGYVSWMRQAGYAPSTIYTAQRLLRRFKAFIREQGLTRQEVFTHDSLKAFESACPRFFAACAVRGLARHLFRRKQIPSPIIRPRILLPDVYEAYLRFFEETRQVLPLSLTTTRRVLSASRTEKVAIRSCFRYPRRRSRPYPPISWARGPKPAAGVCF